MVLDFQSLTLGPHYVCLQPYLFTFQGRGWQRRENMRVFLQTLISHNFLCVQNRAFYAAKSGDVAWEETQGQWAASPFSPLWAQSAPYLYSLLLKTKLFFLNPFTSHHFSFHFASLIFSDLQQGGQEEKRGSGCASLPLWTCWHSNSYGCYSFTTLSWTFLLQHIKLFLLKTLKISALLPSSQWQKEITHKFSLIKAQSLWVAQLSGPQGWIHLWGREELWQRPTTVVLGKLLCYQMTIL